MLGAREKTISKRVGFWPFAILALLLPLSCLVVTGAHIADLHSNHGSAPMARGSHKTVSIWVSDYEGPFDEWVFSQRKNTRFSNREIRMSLSTRRVVGSRPLLLTPQHHEYHHEYRFRLNGWHVLDHGGPPSLLEALEREFGPGWESDQHPQYHTRILPLLEARVLEEILLRIPENAWEKADGSRYSVISDFPTNGTLSVEYQTRATDWGFARKIVPRSILLWLILSIVFFGILRMLHRSAVDRWDLGNCSKCNYPREPARTDCPECGLAYERPSHLSRTPGEDPLS